MALRPLHHDFLFTFTNETRDGLFINKSKGRIQIVTPQMNDQGIRGRWGLVYAVGNKVVDFKAGDYVLIEPGKWTLGVDFEGQKLWKSDDSVVLGVSNDESETYDY